MKRTYRFVAPSGVALCTIDGRPVEIPVFAGILKHPTVDQLRSVLTDPAVARRYTCETLRKAPWAALQLFPRPLLRACLDQARLRPGRRAALELLLEP